jgi:4-coumarate--CoA ligase
LPDEEAGEIPTACVVIRNDAQEKEVDLINYVTSRVASYKRIRALHFVDSIPKSASGKILRRLLREKYLGEK